MNLHGKEPRKSSPSDQRFLGYARRVNLDMMWSRERATVSAILSNVRKGKRMSEALSMKPIDLSMGPWPVGDHQGFQVALEMIRASQEGGRNDKGYQQFDTLRKMRSAYSNIFECSPPGALNGTSFKGAYGHMVHFSMSELNSVFYRQFIYGLEKRMGRVVIQNIALSVEMLLKILDNMEEELRSPGTAWERKREIVMAGAAFVALFTAALRGEEIFMAEAEELCKRIQDGKYDPICSYVLLPLMGRFKHETGERNIMFALASTTEGSGIPVRKWLERLVLVLRKENKHRTIGPALCDVGGYSYPRWKLNTEFHNQLMKLQFEDPSCIAEDVDIAERFSIHRSFRRGATTRALTMKVPNDIVTMNNRWRKSQQRAGSVPNLPMSVLYTEIQQALTARLRFSRSL